MAVGTGTGVTLAGATSGTEVNIVDISWSGWARGSIDTTTNDTTTGRSFLPTTLYDPGEITVSAKLDETTAGNLPAITAAAEAWTITSQSETWICTGFVTNVDTNWPHEDVNTINFTIKFTGAVTGTYSS